MNVNVTFATLPSGPAVTQYGQRAPITLERPADLGFPGNYGRCLWSDATTPRTDKPVRFYPAYPALPGYRADGVYPERSFVAA